MVTIYRNLIKYYVGTLADDVLWPEAIIIQESAGNPWEIGDHGLACGIMQQHPSWQKDNWPSDDIVVDRYMPGTELKWNIDQWMQIRWHPAFQLACFGRFWKHWSGLSPLNRVNRFHYGHLDLTDPDGTVAKYTAIRQGLRL